MPIRSGRSRLCATSTTCWTTSAAPGHGSGCATECPSDVDELPDLIGRNAYRILQESLTNARKHAPNTQVDVVVAGKPGKSLILVVFNPLPVGSTNGTPGAGLGSGRPRRAGRA